MSNEDELARFSLCTQLHNGLWWALSDSNW